MDSDYKGPDRRKHVRIHKNFIMSYHDKNNPQIKYDISQLYNISKGGMCFIATHKFAPLTELAIELRTPYLADAVHFEGSVIESKDKIPNMLYEIRMVFKNLSPITEGILEKIEQYGKKGDYKRDG